MIQPDWLLAYRCDHFSQSGEDGIIEKILEVMPAGNNWCVEFGAWDGIFLTNTRHLITAKNYSAVLIESDHSKFQELEENYADVSGRVYLMNRLVGFDDNDSLDCILSETPIPREFDFLSIDIDGNDFHVWKCVAQYQPRIVCIEFNPTIPTEVEFVQEREQSINQGASLLSIVKLAKEKGYELVCVLTFNAIFVKAEYFDRFQISDNSPQALRRDTRHVTHMFSGFDGRVFLRGGRRLPWHAMDLDENRFQPVPRCIRAYPGNYNRVQRMLFKLFKRLRPG